MHRRDLLRNALSAGAALAAAPLLSRGRCTAFGGTREYSVATIDLVASCPVVDLLGLLTLDWSRLWRWFGDPVTFGEQDLAKLRRSGVVAFHPAVELNERDPRAAAIKWFEQWNGLLAAHPECLKRLDTAADVVRARQEGKVGVLLGMQNSSHFADCDDVRVFHAAGQRISQLTYNAANRLGYGCNATRDRGLTQYGCDIVTAMNRAGMAVDLSHAGERTTLEAIECSQKPVLITHSNCRALMPHPRCKSDRVLRALARRGGVLGLTGISAFVSRRGRGTLVDLLDHYDHAARVAGVEHLGIGSDSDPDGRGPIEIAGVDHPRRVYDLAEGLRKRGYRDTEICGILGGNALRVFGATFDACTSEKVASSI